LVGDDNRFDAVLVQQSNGFPYTGQEDKSLEVVYISHLLVEGSITIEKDCPVSHPFFLLRNADCACLPVGRECGMKI
jgi:hypothetical protein